MNRKQILTHLRSHCCHLKHMISLISLAVLFFLGVGYEGGTAQASASTFYVAPNGDDNNPGTLAKPWRTIQYATSSEAVQPGDTVYIRGGTYNEYIQQERSGVPGNPIVYRNYPGETPVITGSGSWRWHILEQSYIRIEGMSFRDYRKGAIQIRTRNANIKGIEIINNTFENQSQLNNDGAKTIHVTTTDTNFVVSDITIRGNRLLNVDTGDHPAIQIAGEARNIRILDNRIRNTSSIAIGVAGRPDIDQPENILIKGNDISRHGAPGKFSAGIYLDGAGKNIIVEENVIYDGLQGIKVSLEPPAASLVTRYVIIRRNVLFNNSQINLKVGVGGSADNCNQSGRLRKSVAVYNTLFTTLNGSINHRFSCGKNLRWKNNIFVDMSGGDSFQYSLGDNDTVPLATWLLDYNLFYNGDGNGSYRWQGVAYQSLAAFQAASGQDVYSFTGDPKFVDAANGNFQLEADSAARDAGGPLTFTSNAGSGTVIAVAEAWYFTDGLGLQEGDRIRVGDNDPVTVVAVDYANNTLTVDRAIAWQNRDEVNYDYAGAAPDVGAFEFVPQFKLKGVPADRAVYLLWDVNEILPPTAVWQIEYNGPQGTPPSPITGISPDTTQLTLTDLENYTSYEFTLRAMDNGTPLLTDTVRVMPTDIFAFLPHVMKAR